MSDAEFEKITNRAGSGAPNFTYGLNSGGSDSGLAGFAYTASGTEPSSPANGDVWFDTTNDKYYTYINGEFKQLTHVNPIFFLNGGDRAVHHRGYTTGSLAKSSLDYWSIPTTGNAADFGDLLVAERSHQNGNLSNKTRGIYSVAYNTKDLNYITFATTGSAADFGDLTHKIYNFAAGSNGTIGLMNLTRYRDGSDNLIFSPSIIDKITIATAANATDFGYTMSVATIDACGLSDATTFIKAGGASSNSSSATVNTMEKITYDTSANASDFGDLTSTRYFFCGSANSTYGVFAGGQSAGTNVNTMEYITVATASNATDFGDLLAANNGHTSCCNEIRMTIAAGGGANISNTIQYITIATPSNATDFGDLLGDSIDCSVNSGDAS